MMTVKTIVLLLASAQLQAQRVDKCSWFVLENGKADLYGVENYETVFEYPEQLLDYNGLKVKARASDNRKMQ